MIWLEQGAGLEVTSPGPCQQIFLFPDSSSSASPIPPQEAAGCTAPTGALEGMSPAELPVQWQLPRSICIH